MNDGQEKNLWKLHLIQLFVERKRKIEEKVNEICRDCIASACLCAVI